jgi:hypothetical protein
MAVSFDFVNTRIATGGALSDPADVETLVQAGITHIVDATNTADQNYDDVATFANHPAISVFWNPTDDDGVDKSPEYWQDSVNFGMMALSLPHAKLFCHCTSGINRGPSTCFAILLVCGYSADQGLSAIHNARPITEGGVRYSTNVLNSLTELGYI